MKDADALELPLLIQVVKDILVQDEDITLLPLPGRTCRWIPEYVELGDQFDTEMPAPGKKNAHVQNLTYISSDCFVVGDELRRSVQRSAGQAGDLHPLKIVRIFHGDIRTEVTDDFVPPLVVEMVGVFQELLPVDRSSLP
jgi:hypothetical protein